MVFLRAVVDGGCEGSGLRFAVVIDNFACECFVWPDVIDYYYT